MSAWGVVATSIVGCELRGLLVSCCSVVFALTVLLTRTLQFADRGSETEVEAMWLASAGNGKSLVLLVFVVPAQLLLAAVFVCALSVHVGRKCAACVNPT